MALSLYNLEAQTRKLMLEEIDSDIAKGTLYKSPRLTPVGEKDYPQLLKAAAQSHDDGWLAAELRRDSRIAQTEQRRKPKSGFTEAKVPVTAAETLAEGEFNRFYIRGLCVRAIASGITAVVIYRAKQVASPRPESIAKEGNSINAQVLLNDLRTNVGIDTALGLPPGPNSGLSAKLP